MRTSRRTRPSAAGTTGASGSRARRRRGGCGESVRPCVRSAHMVTTAPMLDARIYRAAFVPLLVAVVVVAFSLAERPRPIGTTLAPDAFDGRRAMRVIDELLADPRDTFRD